MASKMKNAALSSLGFVLLKSGQQIMNDLEEILVNKTLPNIIVSGIENTTRLCAPLAAAYTIDETISSGESYLPKFMRGAIPFLATTLGTAAVINYAGQYFDIEQVGKLVEGTTEVIIENPGIIESTKKLLTNYQQALANVINLNSDTHAGYLTGAFLTLKSGARLAKNITQSAFNLRNNSGSPSPNGLPEDFHIPQE